MVDGVQLFGLNLIIWYIPSRCRFLHIPSKFVQTNFSMGLRFFRSWRLDQSKSQFGSHFSKITPKVMDFKKQFGPKILDLLNFGLG